MIDPVAAEVVLADRAQVSQARGVPFDRGFGRGKVAVRAGRELPGKTAAGRIVLRNVADDEPVRLARFQGDLVGLRFVQIAECVEPGDVRCESAADRVRRNRIERHDPFARNQFAVDVFDRREQGDVQRELTVRDGRQRAARHDQAHIDRRHHVSDFADRETLSQCRVAVARGTGNGAPKRQGADSERVIAVQQNRRLGVRIRLGRRLMRNRQDTDRQSRHKTTCEQAYHPGFLCVRSLYKRFRNSRSMVRIRKHACSSFFNNRLMRFIF